MNLRGALLELRRLHGSFEALSKATGVDDAYLYRLFYGAKVNPSEALLRRLGLQRIVQYNIIGNKQ